MRIRLHKSRTTTAIMVVSSLVVISGVAAGASETLNNLLSNSKGGIEKSVNDGNNSGKSNQNHGNNCFGKDRQDNNTAKNDNGVTNGNGESADCNDTSIDPCVENPNANGCNQDPCVENPNANGCNQDPCAASPKPAGCEEPKNGNNGTPQTQLTRPSPTASPLPVSRNIVPRLSNLTTTYNGRTQGVNYTVEPTSANCRVTYNGSTARPTNAGTYNVAIVCRDGRLQGGATGTFVINKAPTTLNWVDPNPITTVDQLSKVQLNAKANVPGTYAYEEKVGQGLPAGTHELNVDFTPRDTNNYLPSSADVNIDVLKYANKFAPIKVPFNLSSAGLTAKTRPIVSKLFLSEDVKEITVYGYVKPSNSKSADMKLSLARAKTVAGQIKSISPDLKINVKAMGATINPACKAYSNKCVIVK